VDSEWDRKEEQLGSPENAGACQRAVELMASGWQIETVLFRTGLWTFRRPRVSPATRTHERFATRRTRTYPKRA
jgi:hypothetical protein